MGQYENELVPYFAIRINGVLYARNPFLYIDEWSYKFSGKNVKLSKFNKHENQWSLKI